MNTKFKRGDVIYIKAYLPYYQIGEIVKYDAYKKAFIVISYIDPITPLAYDGYRWTYILEEDMDLLKNIDKDYKSYEYKELLDISLTPDLYSETYNPVFFLYKALYEKKINDDEFNKFQLILNNYYDNKYDKFRK